MICGRRVCDNFKSVRQERITGEHRRRFIKHFVARKPSSAEIIIVHARQIIMNERIGMDKFQCRSEPKRCFRVTAERLAYFHG